MALSSEDHKDVKGALGKAMANKISKVTRDSKTSFGKKPDGSESKIGGQTGEQWAKSRETKQWKSGNMKYPWSK